MHVRDRDKARHHAVPVAARHGVKVQPRLSDGAGIGVKCRALLRLTREFSLTTAAAMPDPAAVHLRPSPSCMQPSSHAGVEAPRRTGTRMTHQPPIPEAATSPYPLHPEPIPEEQELAAEQAQAKAEADAKKAESRSATARTAVGVGAAIGAGAAVVTGIIYARRRAEKSGTPRKSASGGDDKRKRGKQDRSRVAASEPYEVSYFARKHGISADEARAIIKEAGPSRTAANELAARRKKA
jgi:Protein of unknown function (DUF3606)